MGLLNCYLWLIVIMPERETGEYSIYGISCHQILLQFGRWSLFALHTKMLYQDEEARLNNQPGFYILILIR